MVKGSFTWCKQLKDEHDQKVRNMIVVFESLLRMRTVKEFCPEDNPRLIDVEVALLDEIIYGN